MITLTKDEIEEFKILWFKKYGEQLSDQKAQVIGSRLVRQFSFFYDMIPEQY